MSFVRTGQVTDEYDRPVQGASIYVYKADGADAALTSDGTTPLAQPITTDEFGAYTYYVAAAATYREDTWFGGKLRFREIRAVGLDGLYPLAPRAGMFFAFDADGNPVAATGTGGGDAALRTDLAANTGASQIGAAGGGTAQDAIDKLGDEDFSATPSSGQSAIPMEKTFAGEAGDDSDYRGILLTCNLVGDHGAFQMNNLHLQNEVRHTSGTISFAQAVEGYVRLGLQGSTTGDIAAAHVFKGHIANESLGSNIAGATVFQASDTDYGDDIAGAAGTIGTVIGFSTGDLSHATKLTTEAYGFFAGNMTAPAAGVTVAAFATEMAGSGKWAILSSGNSPSAHLGNVRIGDTATVPTEALEVRGNAVVESGRIGYKAGGSVTQATSKSTAVTLDKPAGQITLSSAALAAGAVVFFPVNTSFVQAADAIVLNIKGGHATNGTYRAWVDTVADGQFTVAIENRSGGSLSEAVILNFAIIKGASA